MDAHDFLKQIKDKNSLAILSGLSGITEYVRSRKIRPDLANTLFHALIPLLNHNHYKIRSMSMALTEVLFLKAFNWLSDTTLALPLLLFALSSVKEDIRKSARVSLAILCDSLNVEDWWDEVANCLLMSRSTTKVHMKGVEGDPESRTPKRSARKDVTILKMLKHMANRIPLKPIVSLVDDPVKEVSDLAVDVLLAADFEKARAALIDSHLTFGTYQKVYETFMSHGQTMDLDASDDGFALDLGAKDSIAGQLRDLGSVSRQNSVVEQARRLDRGEEMRTVSQAKRTMRQPLKPQKPMAQMSQRSVAGQLGRRDQNEEPQSARSRRSVTSQLGKQEQNEEPQSARFQRSVTSQLRRQDQNEEPQSARSRRSVTSQLSRQDLNEEPQSARSQRSVTSQLRRQDQNEEPQSARSRRSVTSQLSRQDLNEEPQSARSQRSVTSQLRRQDQNEEPQSARSQRSVTSQVGREEQNEEIQSARSQRSQAEPLEGQSVPAAPQDSVKSAREQLKEALVSALDSTRGVHQQMSLVSPTLKIDGYDKASGVRTQQSMIYHSRGFGEPGVPPQEDDRQAPSVPGQKNPTHGVKQQMSLASPKLKMDGLDNTSNVRDQQSMIYKVRKLGGNTTQKGSAPEPDADPVPTIVVNEEDFLQPHEEFGQSSASRRVRRQMSLASPVLKMENVDRGVRAQQSMVYRVKQFGDDNLRRTSAQGSRAKNDDARSIKSQASRDLQGLSDAAQPRETGNLNQPIPMTVVMKKKELPFALRDMTQMSWLERCTYLEMLEKAVESDKMLDTPGSEIIKCALTASFPLHKKTTPILAGLLAKLVLMYPEGLNENLEAVVHLLLHAIRPPSILKAGNGKVLLDAILSEAIPDRVIDAAVSIASENNRPVLMEQFILMVYENKPDTVLPRAVFRNLLSYLLNNRPRSEARDKLLFLLCRKDTADVIQFYDQQSKEIRIELRPFIPLEEYIGARRTTGDDEFDIPISQRSQQWLKSAIEKEFKMGARSNFKLLAEALKALVIDDFDTLMALFKKFLIYLSTLPESFIQEHRLELDDLCAAVFASPQLFSVFDAKNVRPRIVKGFSTFIWHCPMSMMSSSAAYYPKFYKLFQESDSDQRLAIIKTAIAIENVTGQSILALKDISRLHRNVITSLLSQFQVSEIAH